MDRHAWDRRAIALRHALPALQEGSVHTVRADDARQVLVRLRQAGNDLAVVALNRREAEQVIDFAAPAGRTWTDIWNGGSPRGLGTGRLVLRLAGLSGAVRAAN